ncbi:hypothetical protein ABFB09_00320 [Dehalogenimonas sp. THU2]|uniref:hypothetical protein n=1 Tax=Dehalogenimonas sp. THU2 TaxID=3151121 RepID=UPI003218CAD2
MSDKTNSESNQTGDIEMAIKTALPMIDQIAIQARSQAQRASALAMHEYRRKLQGIVLDLQDTVREEGARLAEQMRQAVILQAEEKALDLVDDFIHGRQAEAASLSDNLLMADESAENTVLELEEAPAPVPVNEFPMPPQTEEQLTSVENTQEEIRSEALNSVSDPVVKSKTTEPKKTAVDFASFISRP